MNGECKRTDYLCMYADIPEGESRGFDPLNSGQDSVLIVKSSGELHAWRNECPHIDGAPMAWRKHAYLNAAKTHISCHAHGALFEIDTGVCIQGPCLGKRLQSVQVTCSEDGRVSMTQATCY